MVSGRRRRRKKKGGSKKLSKKSGLGLDFALTTGFGWFMITCRLIRGFMCMCVCVCAERPRILRQRFQMDGWIGTYVSRYDGIVPSPLVYAV